MPKIPAVCETAFDLAYHPVYQSSNYYQLIISFLSIFPLVYFICFKLLKSSFHGNLKTIFIGYYASFFLYSTINVTASTIQVIKPLVSIEKCDLIIPPTTHKIGSTLKTFFLMVSTFSPFMITIERYFALITSEKYERTRVALGPLILGTNVLLNIYIVYSVFNDEAFSDGSVSFSVYPAMVAQKMFTIFIVLFFLNLVDVLFDLILLRQNVRLKKQLMSSSLTAKYQLEEVYQSTKFSIFIVLIHVISFGLYVSAVVFLRYFGSYVLTNSEVLFGLRTYSSNVGLSSIYSLIVTFQMVSTYQFIIGIVSIFLFNRIKSKKAEGTILMSSTGRSGANNYDQAIFNIWNSVSNPTNVTQI